MVSLHVNVVYVWLLLLMLLLVNITIVWGKCCCHQSTMCCCYILLSLCVNVVHMFVIIYNVVASEYHQCCDVNVAMLPLLHIAVIVDVLIIISKASSIKLINQVTMFDSNHFTALE